MEWGKLKQVLGDKLKELQEQSEQSKMEMQEPFLNVGKDLGLNEEQAKDFAETGLQIGQQTGTIGSKLPPSIVEALTKGGAKKIATTTTGVKMSVPSHLEHMFGKEVTIPHSSLGEGDFGKLTHIADEQSKNLGRVFVNESDVPLNLAEKIKNAEAAEKYKSIQPKWQEMVDTQLDKEELFSKLKNALIKK